MTVHGLNGEFAGRVMLAFALISGLCLMYPFANAGRLVLDEHGSYWIAGPENPSSLLDRSLNYAAIPPLSGLLQRAFLTVFGKSEFVFRASSAVCYLAAVFVTFLLGCELLGTLGGGTAALLVAWHPTVLDEVRIARCYGLVLLLAAFSLWATVRWRKEPHRMRWMFVWAAANGGLICTHYVAIPLIPLEVLLLVRLLPWRPARRTPYRSQLVVAALFLCLLLVGLWPSLSRMWLQRELLNYNTGGVAAWKIIGPIWWLGLPAGWAAGALLSIRTSTRPSALRLPDHFWVLLVWGLLPYCLVALLSRGNLTSLSNPRYSVCYAVPAACFLASCLSSRRSVTATLAGVSVLLAATWLCSDLRPWEMRRLRDRSADDWYEMARQVAREGKPGEPVFVLGGLAESSLVAEPTSRQDAVFMDYISCRLGRFYLETPHPRYGLPLIWLHEDALKRFYLDLLEFNCGSDVSAFWVAVATDTDMNRASLRKFQAFLAEQSFAEATTRHWDSAVLIRYECPSLQTERR